MLSLDFELRIVNQDARMPPAGQYLPLWKRLVRRLDYGRTPAGQYVNSKTLLANPDEYIGKVRFRDNVFVVKKDEDTILREDELTKDGTALSFIVLGAVMTVPTLLWGRDATVDLYDQPMAFFLRPNLEERLIEFSYRHSSVKHTPDWVVRPIQFSMSEWAEGCMELCNRYVQFVDKFVSRDPANWHINTKQYFAELKAAIRAYRKWQQRYPSDDVSAPKGVPRASLGPKN